MPASESGREGRRFPARQTVCKGGDGEGVPAGDALATPGREPGRINRLMLRADGFSSGAALSGTGAGGVRASRPRADVDNDQPSHMSSALIVQHKCAFIGSGILVVRPLCAGATRETLTLETVAGASSPPMPPRRRAARERQRARRTRRERRHERGRGGEEGVGRTQTAGDVGARKTSQAPLKGRRSRPRTGPQGRSGRR